MENRSVIYVFDPNQNSRELLKLYLEELGVDCEIKLYSDYNLGITDIQTSEKSPIVFLDVSDISEKTAELIDSFKLYTSRIVITSIDYSTNNIIKAMRLGACDFLPKPIIKDELKRAITILLRENLTEDTISKIITVYSNKGGIGKTTIATNLAMELARTTGDKVALVDLNLQLGDVSTFLNLNPTFDVAYVIKNLVGKNDTTILEAFEKVSGTNLYVLSDPAYIEQSESITTYQLDNLFNSLKKIFPFIVVDMSSNIDANSLKILDKSDLILFTTLVTIPAIRNAQRCLNLFRSRRYPNDRVKLIINRYMENDDIKIEDIEITLGEKVYWKIPNNYFSIMEAINKGIPVSDVNPNSNIANSFRDLASKISDDIVREFVIKYRGS